MLNKVIKEQLDPNIKIALYSNFSNAYEAIQEITDNSVSHRIIGKKLQIKLFFIPKSKKLVIEDIGGQGMNLEDLEMFFNWGKSKPRNQYDIGLYSQGGKSAIGYLGNSFVLITSPVNGADAYKIEDDNLLDTTKLKEYRVGTFAAGAKEGYTSIEIGKLKILQEHNAKLTELNSIQWLFHREGANWIPNNPIKIENENTKKEIKALYEALDDEQDINEIYDNTGN